MDSASADWQRRPKVGHKKSRKGCKKCKARRVKCDEVRPICRNCDRLGLECVWPDFVFREVGPPQRSQYVTPVVAAHLARALAASEKQDVASSSAQSQASSSSSPRDEETFEAFIRAWAKTARNIDQHVFSSLLETAEPEELSESRSRRFLEHRLMQHWLFELCNPFPVSPSPEWGKVFGRTIPALALKHDNLLYAVLSLSATHWLQEEPDNTEMFNARQRYLIASMREQRRMVANLTLDIADPVCFASLIIVITSFAMLRERVLEPYAPPMDWLQLGRGAGVVMWTSVDAVIKAGDPLKAAIMTVANSHPRFGADRSYFNEEMRRDFSGVLTQELESGDTWDDETREAYEKTLSYVGSIQKAIYSGEPVYAICRRIQVFALVIPRKFLTLLEEQRPRALVILAHYFAATAQVHGVWWLGEGNGDKEGTAKREIRAISKVLPAEWQGQMVWPVDTVGIRV